MQKKHIIFLSFLFATISCIQRPSSLHEISRVSVDEIDAIASKFKVTYEPMSNTELLMGPSPQTFFSKPFLSNEKVPRGGNCELRDDYKIPSFFMFFPAYKGKLRHIGDSLSFKNYCFQKNTLTLVDRNEDSISLELTVSDAKSYLCNDIYLFFTSSIHQVKMVYFKGTYHITINDLSTNQLTEIGSNGLRVFAFCDNVPRTLASAYKTAKFIMTNPAPEPGVPKPAKVLFDFPDWGEVDFDAIAKEHVEFLKTYGNLKMYKRVGYEDKILPVEKYIKSGDFIGLHEVVSGESCLIQYGCGSAISHSAIAIRHPVTNELYIAEAEDRGLLLKTYKEFLDDNILTMHSIAWFPLREEYSKKFDSKKAWEWTKKRVGQKYGMSNFISGSIDTLTGSTPEYLALEHVMLVVAIMEAVDEEVAQQYLIDGLNVRIGTNFTTLQEVVEEISRRNKTVEDIFIMPEREDYIYKNGENWICSSFVVGIMKAGGIFGDLKIEPHEFTPRDIYQMDIYDKEFKKHGPKECLEADPELDYCMIYGEYDIRAEGYSTIPLYDHMNERCSSMPPLYIREEGC